MFENAFYSLIYSLKRNRELRNLRRVEDDLNVVIEKYPAYFIAQGFPLKEMNEIKDPLDRFLCKLDSIKYASEIFNKNEELAK